MYEPPAEARPIATHYSVVDFLVPRLRSRLQRGEELAHSPEVERDSAAAVTLLEQAGAEVQMLPGLEGRADLRRVLALLAERGANEVWVEAGAVLAGAFIRDRLFD